MKFDRRDLLLSGPAALFGFQIAEALRAQGQSAAPVDSNVVDFWVRGMGVPSNTVVGGGAHQGTPAQWTLGERLRPRAAVSASRCEGERATHSRSDNSRQAAWPPGPLASRFSLVRMRLNDADNTKFKDYSSGGIYVDLQQTAPRCFDRRDGGDRNPGIVRLQRDVPAGRCKSGGGERSGSGEEEGQGQSISSEPQASSSGAGGAAVPLQQAKQATIDFAAERRGPHVIRMFREGSQEDAVRQVHRRIRRTGGIADALVSAHAFAAGGWRFDLERGALAGGEFAGARPEPAVDHDEHADRRCHHAAGRAERAGCASTPAGNYVLIPKEQSDAIKAQLDKLKVLDGFLVPKEAKALDVYDAYPSAAPGVSYITLSVGVQAQAARPRGKVRA